MVGDVEDPKVERELLAELLPDRYDLWHDFKQIYVHGQNLTESDLEFLRKEIYVEAEPAANLYYTFENLTLGTKSSTVHEESYEVTSVIDVRHKDVRIVHEESLYKQPELRSMTGEDSRDEGITTYEPVSQVLIRDDDTHKQNPSIPSNENIEETAVNEPTRQSADAEHCIPNQGSLGPAFNELSSPPVTYPHDNLEDVGNPFLAENEGFDWLILSESSILPEAVEIRKDFQEDSSE